jgi:type IV pilus assembly protein PilC
MSLFRYRALDPDGRRVRGALEAADLDELERALRARKLLLIAARPAQGRWLPTRRIPRRELIPFFFQLEQLLDAGVPPHESLATLRDASTGSRLHDTATALLAAVERGQPLSAAAATRPEAFSSVATSLLRAGEEAGRLPAAVRDIGAVLTREEALAAHARRIAIYPAFVGLILLVAVVVALTQVVPELEKLLRSAGQTLPLQTRILVGVSHAVRDWGLALALAALVGAGVALSALARSVALRTRLHALQLRLPLIGAILRKLALARFAAVLGTLYAAGINIVDALRTSEASTANLALREGLRSARHAIEQGRPVAAAFEATGVFPPLINRMLRLGEQTGAMDEALAKIVTLYNHEVGEGIARLQAAAEPALTLLMGGLLLWIASAVLDPIYSLITRLPV